ncbi:MAG TPA: DUF1704 domain-containing protein [Candidatus Melainabacteria bacterium]|nr:DUF1704 domain-containing protein [Candidatus Melainabacteria bacterium]HMP52003.1 DUF1704 domain-containing protein [Candidatus Melainabacteria bacterium]
MKATLSNRETVKLQLQLTSIERKVDQELSEISAAIDFLYLLQPENLKEIETSFLSDRSREEPLFRYANSPAYLKKIRERLLALPLSKVNDPILKDLFQSEKATIVTTISMLSKRGSQRFLKDSIKLYGSPDDNLTNTAFEILEAFPGKSKAPLKNDYLEAQEFADFARREINLYRKRHSFIESTVQVDEHLTSILVSGGNLSIGSRARVPRCRKDATIAHEVGVHLVTFWNGSQQPLSILSGGLSSYEELQEGLAVFSEYLAGGLTRNRLRTLAARVIAVKRMLEGRSFLAVFQELTEDFGLGERIAFDNTVRVFRGGGMTRPAVYLRGLIWILDYVKAGGDLEILLTGKLGIEHIPVVKELMNRGLVTKPVVYPRLLRNSAARARLARARSGMNIIELVADL